MQWIVIALGGAAGTLLRHSIALWLSPSGPGHVWPWATWLVNMAGSFLLALLYSAVADRHWLGVEVRLILGAGFCGALTTYSTYNLEMLRMLQQARWSLALAYGLTTTAGALLAAGLGWWCGRELVS